MTAASKQYTGSGRVGFRLFDVMLVTTLGEKSTWPAQRISGWRDGGGQEFVGEQELLGPAGEHGLTGVPRTGLLDPGDLPTELGETHRFPADRLPRTTIALGGDPGRAEGPVLRTGDRTVIAKPASPTTSARRNGGTGSAEPVRSGDGPGRPDTSGGRRRRIPQSSSPARASTRRWKR